MPLDPLYIMNEHHVQPILLSCLNKLWKVHSIGLKTLNFIFIMGQKELQCKSDPTLKGFCSFKFTRPCYKQVAAGFPLWPEKLEMLEMSLFIELG